MKMEHILYGKPVAQALEKILRERAEALKGAGVIPTLAIIRVGESGSDLSYEKGAMKRCANIGIAVKNIVLPITCTQDELLEKIREVNNDAGIHGCLLFRPLPKHINEYEVCEALNREKDVDCITNASLSKVFTGRGIGFASCTAESAMEILKYYGCEIEGKNVTVVGRSLVCGKIVAMMLLSENGTVTMAHSRTKNLAGACRKADILVVAAGHPGLINVDFVNDHQVVIDIGINVRDDGTLCGDVCYDEVEGIVAGITPVPGGVGAVTTAVLCRHVIEAAERCNM